MSIDDRPPLTQRRWRDRPGRTPSITLARLLTTRPQLGEIPRCLVAILSWPVGASGAILLRQHGDEMTTLARYEEPLDPQRGARQGQQSEPCVTDIVTAAAGLSPVIWTEPGHPGCRPMAAWPLDTSGDHIDHLVLVLAAPLDVQTVSDRLQGIPEVLAVYLSRAGNEGSEHVSTTQASASAVPRLSPRQMQILGLMADDLTLQQIASRIGFSDSTVRTESVAIYRSLGVHDRRHAVAVAREEGLLPFQGT
jgi:DNA-binding CsgD family transcriptional regulator